MPKGTLFLIPAPIAEDTAALSLTPQMREVLPRIQHFLAEDIRTARRFLSALKVYPSIEQLEFTLLNKDTSEADVSQALMHLDNGFDMGVLSESGCPGVADPGALAVRLAHRRGARVVPLVGPSSILLALMASGLNGQQFAFHGYLPIDQKELGRRLHELEKESAAKNQSQIFIETPYRNHQLISKLCQYLSPNTLLTIACDIQGNDEMITTRTVGDWKKSGFVPPKKPCVFLFLAN